MEVELKVVSGPEQGRVVRISEPDRFIFGRAEDARIRVTTDPFVSRQHFMLEYDPPQLRVADLQSKNGVLVDGVLFGGRKPPPDHIERATTPLAQLSDGSEIQVGQTKILVSIPAPEPEPDSARSGLEEDSVARQRVLEAVLRRSRQRGSGEYRVLEDLPQRGGMGKLAVAEDAGTGRRVVIKTILPDFAVNQRDVDAFVRECEIAIQLRHSNICAAFDAGFLEGEFYFVMEYVDGPDLGARLRKDGPLPLKEAAPFMLATLDGLAYAHTQPVKARLADGSAETFVGVVHRDLKPENIMLDLSGPFPEPKIIDFGLAKAFDAAGRLTMTNDGDIAGTVQYWPREQVTAYRYLGPPSDVFSIAAVFYEVLTGELPRDGFDDHGLGPNPPLAALAMRVLTRPVVPIRERLPDFPEPAARVIDRALTDEELELRIMSRDEATEYRNRLAQMRYPDARQFRVALTEAFRQVGLV